jgi:CRP-like cAMP-binding protein
VADANRNSAAYCSYRVNCISVELIFSRNAISFRELGVNDTYGQLDLLFRNRSSKVVEKYFAQHELHRIKLREAGLLEDEDVVEEQLPRGLSSGSFISINVMSPTEVLLITADDFYQYLYRIAEKDFENRKELLEASGLFVDDLNVVDMVRLARMSRIQAFKPGEIILNQGEIPSKLFFVMSGICKVHRRPDKAERTRARLQEMKEHMDEHDMKYSFHHRLRGLLEPAPPEFGAVAENNFATSAEYIRHNMGLEMKKIEQSAILKEKNTADTEAVDVTTLKWPMLFGESSVAIPEGRSSLGTVAAETYCEILWIHKVHMQTFRLGETFQERLRLRSVKYPPDHVLVDKFISNQEWSEYKGEVLGSVSKTKWPGYIKPKGQGMKF